MMIQINLLPDVKEKYIKTQRLKRMVIGGSVVVIVVSITITALLSSVVYVAQKVKLDNSDKNIKKYTSEINNIQDLDKILTIQSQLSKLTGLHDTKPVTSRLFEFLPQITPPDVTISRLNIGFAADDVVPNSLLITGSSSSLEATNRFVDTLKYTKYTVEGKEEQKNAFSSVVLTSFGIDKNGGATYTVTMTYDPELFKSSNKSVKLIIPKQVTSQSTTQRPNPLFNQAQTGNQ